MDGTPKSVIKQQRKLSYTVTFYMLQIQACGRFGLTNFKPLKMKSETEIQYALNYIFPKGKMNTALFLTEIQLKLDSHYAEPL